MAELKTKPNDADSHALRELMAGVTGDPGAMWGSSIVGFGSYSYRYASGRTGEWLAVGFSPRKQNLTLYIMDGFDGYDELLGKLGNHSTGKSCLYVKRLSDVDTDVLRELVVASVAHVTAA